MKNKFNIKSIIITSAIGVMSFACYNPCFAATTAKVSVETANIRKSADSNSKIVEQASSGQSVEIIEKNGEWYKIKYNGIEGYLRQDLLDIKDEAKTETAPAEVPEPTPTAVPTAVPTQTPEAVQTATNVENTSAVVSQTETTENTGIYRCKENTQLKLIPLILGHNITEITKDTTLSVLEIDNKWALVECGVNRGWVLLSKIEKEAEQNPVENKGEENKEVANEQQEENKTESEEKTTPESAKEAEKEITMYVNSEVVNLRASENTSSDSLAKLSKGTEVIVISTNNGWSKVKANGKEGYISASLLSTKKPEVVTSRSAEEARQTNQTVETKQDNTTETANAQATATTTSNKGNDVCSYAKQYLGCKYVMGGTSPSGFDCSGFTQYVYKHFGVNLNRTAESQTGNGTAVSKSNLKAGDLVIFTSHVGIYLGNGTFIHAANPKKGVITTSMSDSYYVKNYITARRIFN